MNGASAMNKNGFPRVTELLSYFHAYDAYPNEGYYMKRGTWVGDCTDIIAMGDTLNAETLAFGQVVRERPLTRRYEAAKECWMDYVLSYQKLILSHEFTSQFVRCLGVQEEMVNDIYRYVGHLDQRWLMTDGEAIFDIKAALVIPAATPLQLAFYDLGRPFGKRRKRYAVHLRPNRPGVLQEYNNNADYDAARLLAQAYWAAKGFIG